MQSLLIKNYMISIITPTYNRANSIKDTIQSLIHQKYGNWELLIIDDGSSDNTEEILKEFMKADSRIKYYKRPQNRLKGANACRNIGIQYVEGDYVIFLDSDDCLPPDFLSDRTKFISNNSEFDLLVSSNSAIITKNLINIENESLQDFFLKNFLAFHFPWKITEVMWRAKSIKDMRFDENLQRFQDIDFHINILLNKKLRIVVDQGLINFYRNKDEGKYEKKEFINRVLYNYDFLYKKYLELLEKPLRPDLYHSNRVLIKFLLKLKFIDDTNFNFWCDKIKADKNYPVKTKYILSYSLRIYRFLPMISGNFKNRLINKLISYS